MREDERRVAPTVDQQIDAALRLYAEPPDPGSPRLAVARLLEQARQQEAPANSRWAWLAGRGTRLVAPAALFTLALVLLVSFLAVRKPTPAGIAALPPAPVVPAALPSAAPAMTHLASPRPHPVFTRHPRHPAALPRQDVFPTPEPLSAEEKALMVFADQTPQSVQKSVLERQKHLSDPISIAALQIRPLDSDTTGNHE